MIECVGVCAGYGGKPVISGIDLRAESGKITAVIGRNGCGKTTLLRAVSGGIGYRGSISIGGIELRDMKPARRARKIAVMAQLPRSPHITVRELVLFGRQPYTGFGGIYSRTDRDFAEDIITRLGLFEAADEYIDRISGGERQKAYLGMLLSQDAENLLLDEPSSHLDAAYSNRLGEFLFAEKSRGKAILAVYHDINRVMSLADRIILMEDGRVKFAGTPYELSESGEIERVFGMRRFVCNGENSGRTVLYI